MSKSFTWLHLSDLHSGMKEIGTLWPQVKEELFKDLPALLARTGKIDAVLFTGDMAFAGEADEFDRVTDILLEFFAIIEQVGKRPVLITVPGNHDLVRPNPKSPAALLLHRWWSEDVVRDQTFATASNDYRDAIKAAFGNYIGWNAKLSDAGIQIPKSTPGIMPGDLSVEIDGNSVGIVGLNSTWLQLNKGDYNGQLDVDVRQLYAVTGEDVYKWTSKHDFNLLLTHQPPSWLKPEALENWNTSINPPGRFDVHLYGHMHNSDGSYTGIPGATPRLSWQSTSLFGLEKFENTYERSHGYAAGRLNKQEDGNQLTIWPRRLQIMSGGYYKIKAAPDFELVDDEVTYPVNKPTPPSTSGQLVVLGQDISSLPMVPEAADVILNKARKYLPKSPAAKNVRKVEQRLCSEALQIDHAVWIAAEWGSGIEGFLWSLQQNLDEPDAKTFKIDLQDYTDRESFLSGIKARLNVSFEQFCTQVADAGTSYLWLDDFPLWAISPLVQASVIADLEAVVNMAFEFAPNLKVVITTRVLPEGATFPSVPLRPLDEPDTLTYVKEHEKGGDRFANSSAIATIYRHTDGVPARLDTALRDLEFIALDQLATSNRDLNRLEGLGDDVPKGLAEAVLEFSGSQETVKKRSYMLLKALSVFPHGETLENIKRFYGAHPLTITHARELMGSSLIVTSARSSSNTQDSQASLLLVPKTVRDFVLARLKPIEWKELSRRAAEMYFGEKWGSGTIRKSALATFADPHAEGAELTNAGAIVARVLNNALSSGVQTEIQAALDLAKGYVKGLSDGVHYRLVAVFSRDILPLVPQNYASRVMEMQCSYGRSLRMLNEYEAAKEALQPVLASKINDIRQSGYVNLALVEVALKNRAAAIAAAQEALNIDPKNGIGLHAKAILLQNREKVENRPKQLFDVEKRARRRGSHVVANNLAIDRASKEGISAEDADKALRQVIESALKDKDFYNGARALLRQAEILIGREYKFTDKEKKVLQRIYLYAMSERMPGIFEQAHNVLWDIYENDGNTRMLITLFRQSSLSWRLRGRADREDEALKKLAKKAKAIISAGEKPDRETVYYLVRIANTKK